MELQNHFIQERKRRDLNHADYELRITNYELSLSPLYACRFFFRFSRFLFR